MKKRIICMLLGLVMCLSLAACGLGSEPEATTETEDKYLIDLGDLPEFTIDSIDPDSVGGAANQIDILIPTIPEFNITTYTYVPKTKFEFDLLVEPIKIDLSTFDVSNYASSNVDSFSAEDIKLLKGMEKAEAAKIAEKHANLLADLTAAFKKANLSVQVNETTGEIALDATVLFALDESNISEAGKQLLVDFMDVYTAVVFSDRYEGFISEIVVEGHTDTSGSYDYNMTLSQKRAETVMAFLQSDECGIGEAEAAQLANGLSAVGYSYDKPIYGADGKVDAAASRRVSFRFLINVE